MRDTTHWVGTWMGKMEMPSMPGMEALPPGVHPGFAALHTPEHRQSLTLRGLKSLPVKF